MQIRFVKFRVHIINMCVFYLRYGCQTLRTSFTLGNDFKTRQTKRKKISANLYNHVGIILNVLFLFLMHHFYLINWYMCVFKKKKKEIFKQLLKWCM